MITLIMESIVIPKPPAPPSLSMIPLSDLTPLLQKQHDHNSPNSSSESLNTSSPERQTSSKQTRNSSLIPTPPKPPPPPPPKLTPKTPLDNNFSSVRSSNSNNSNGFRLADDNCDTGSVYSVYKQKIDQMFDSDTSLNTKNSVQARIDQMFTDTPKNGKVEENLIGVHSFTVDYLGSMSLNDKVTSLAGLQNPLKELYFAYKKITRTRKMLTGRLEISSQGLKVQYQDERGDLEQMNSFPTIAVWSAVKFVINEYDSSKKSYAFLPLITDPDNVDKKTLFRNFEGNEEKYINSDAHSPLFAVVMRKMGVHKQLECHGFVCQTSEDAIVIAATLYKALMSQMKAKEKRPKNRNGVTCMSIASSVYNEKSNNLPVRPPRRKRSAPSSVVSDQDTNNLEQTSDTQPLIRTHTKNTPRKSTKTRRAPKAPSEKQEDLDAITPYEEPIRLAEMQQQNSRSSGMSSSSLQTGEEIKEVKPQTYSDRINTRMSQEQKLITAEIKEMISGSNSGRGLKRRSDDIVRKKEHSGDILTKVTIPRSGSFLNAGGLTRYKSKVTRSNGQASGGSPLGFHELFNEFRINEGLHSVDDILEVIIDPDGMSFNDLKPIYKEFLLKLSVTLTKDELYQRSKSIMRRQRKKMLRKTKGKSNRLRIGSKFRRLKRVFQKGLRWKMYKRPKKQKIEIETVQTKLPESTISSSSYDTRHFTPKEDVQGAKKQTQKKKSQHLDGRRDRLSTSEESDFLSVRRQKVHVTMNGNQNRNSSSGYVSCSDCSYNSDSCTCTSADKCYCSLGNKRVPNRKKCKPKQGKVLTENCYCVDGTLTFCDCDTDSCAESNKCYCQRPAKNTTLLEQLKQRGFVPPVDKSRKLCKRDSNTKSTKSLEYMHNPKEKYHEKTGSMLKSIDHYYNYTFQNVCSQKHSGYCESLPVQYDLFSSNEDFRKYKGVGMYPRALSESEKIGLLKQSSSRAYRSERCGTGRRDKLIQATSIAASTSCNDALSVKKTAEIAALFADMRLTQTTDVSNFEGFERSVNPMVVSNNMYNKFRNNGYVTSRSMTYADVNPTETHGTRMIQNSLYSTGRNFHKASNAKLFNSKNGLYTIQSQSDDSRRSSTGKTKERPRFFLEMNSHYDRLESDRNSLENSLGYLP